MSLSAQLIGGLGNQLFILAHGYKLAKEQGRELVIDDSGWYAGQGEHPRTYKDALYKGFKFGKGEPIPKGYYQGERYFEPYGREFVELLDIDLQPVSGAAVHVRRGDYIGSKHEVCTMDYYRRAMEGYEGFTIFSDDPWWCTAQFPGASISYGSVLASFIHMAGHEVVICSNSSFSWWASYIGKAKTIVPDKWYKRRKDEAIYRKDMIRV